MKLNKISTGRRWGITTALISDDVHITDVGINKVTGMDWIFHKWLFCAVI